MSKSILSNEKECFLCGRKTCLEKHHIMSGTANRRLSEKYGGWIYLCSDEFNGFDCHTGKNGAQYNKEVGLSLKKQFQSAFEEIHGHDFWMEVFKKNYL